MPGEAGAPGPARRLVLASGSPTRLRVLRAAGLEPEVVVSGVNEDLVLAASPGLGPGEAAVALARAKAEAVAAASTSAASTSGASASAASTFGASTSAAFGGAASTSAGSTSAGSTAGTSAFGASTSAAFGGGLVGTGPLVLGCDSLLDVDGHAQGKPATPALAREWWHRLRGRSAVLVTGHHLVDAATGLACGEVAATTVRFGCPTDAEIDAYVATGEPLAVAGGFTLDGRAAAFVDGVDGDPNNVLGVSVALLRTLLRRLDVEITSLWR